MTYKNTYKVFTATKRYIACWSNIKKRTNIFWAGRTLSSILYSINTNNSFMSSKRVSSVTLRLRYLFGYYLHRWFPFSNILSRHKSRTSQKYTRYIAILHQFTCYPKQMYISNENIHRPHLTSNVIHFLAEDIYHPKAVTHMGW